MSLTNIAILSSSRASHLDWLYQATQQEQLPIRLCAVITDRAQAPALNKAYHYALPAWAIYPQPSRQATDQAIHYYLQQQQTHYVFLIGYKRQLSAWLCQQWCQRIFNIHPSLLPKYQCLYNTGVHEAVIANQEPYTGCTLHDVTSQVDQGRIRQQHHCHVDPADTPESLKSKVYQLEVNVLYNFIKQLSLDDANHTA